MTERKTLCILWEKDCRMKTKITSLTEIQARIYLVRGVQVMIDRDLAMLYGLENRALRQAVRRNCEKFPDDFLLKLTEELSPAVTTEQLFSSGCVWDAYTLVCDLVPLFNRNSQSVGTARNTCLRIKMEAAKYRISQKIIQRIKQFLI